MYEIDELNNNQEAAEAFFVRAIRGLEGSLKQYRSLNHSVWGVESQYVNAESVLIDTPYLVVALMSTILANPTWVYLLVESTSFAFDVWNVRCFQECV